MKKLLAILLLMVFVCPSAFAGEPFRVSGEYTGEIRIVGHLYVDDSTEAIPIIFTQEAKDVVISHESGVSLSLKNVFPGDVIFVFSYIPDTMPNLSVSYSFPGEEIVYKRLISQSGRDSSYIIMGDWYTEYAWYTAKRMISLLEEDLYRKYYGFSEELFDYFDRVSAALPREMPNNNYFVSFAPALNAIDSYLELEGIEIRPENMEYLKRRLPSSFIASAVSSEGAIAAAALSVMRASEYVILPDIPFEPGYIVFDNGGDYAIVVSVIAAGEGIAGFEACAVSREALTSISNLDMYLADALN